LVILVEESLDSVPTTWRLVPIPEARSDGLPLNTE
jgi:hypothetical protein